MNLESKGMHAAHISAFSETECDVIFKLTLIKYFEETDDWAHIAI